MLLSSTSQVDAYTYGRNIFVNFVDLEMPYSVGPSTEGLTKLYGSTNVVFGCPITALFSEAINVTAVFSSQISTGTTANNINTTMVLGCPQQAVLSDALTATIIIQESE